MLVKLALAVLATLTAAAPCPEGVQVVENCKQSGQIAWTFDGECSVALVQSASDHTNRARSCLECSGPDGAQRPGREAEAHGHWRTGSHSQGWFAPRGA